MNGLWFFFPEPVLPRFNELYGYAASTSFTLSFRL
jgi:hypothetical protein